MAISFLGAVRAGDTDLGRGEVGSRAARASRTRSGSTTLVDLVNVMLITGRDIVNVFFLVIQSDFLLFLLSLSGSDDF
jgi:hypothetical protein